MVCQTVSIEARGAHLSRRIIEFPPLFGEMIDSGYLDTPEGRHRVAAYEDQRRHARENFTSVAAAADRGVDVTELVLLKLLPHYDSAGNKDRGAWVHLAPAIHGNIKRWFEGVGWTKAEDWPLISNAILRFVRRCYEDPNQLSGACSEFHELPYSKGLQAGMLTPILNALRPDDYLIVHHKSQQAINYFTGESHGRSLTDYPAINAAGRALVEQVGAEMHRPGVPMIRDADLLDMFSHWLVAMKKYRLLRRR